MEVEYKKIKDTNVEQPRTSSKDSRPAKITSRCIEIILKYTENTDKPNEIQERNEPNCLEKTSK